MIGPFLFESNHDVVRDPVILPDYVIIPGNFTEKELKGILKYAQEKGNYENAKIGNTSKGETQKGIRQTDIWFFKHNKLKNKIEKLIAETNNKLWKLNIDACEFFQLGVYRKGGHYSWHQDTYQQDTKAYRKLSFSMVLNSEKEYKGGDFQICSRLSREGKPLIKTVKKIKQNPGDIVLFLSSTSQRVTPVTEGERISLVGWVWGPRLT